METAMVKSEEVKKSVKQEDIRLLVSSGLLGVLFDILFYNKPLGISYLLFVIGFYLVFLGSLRHRIGFKLNFAWSLSIPIIVLSTTYFIFSNLIFAVFNFLIIPILIITQTILLCGHHKYQWFEVGFLQHILYGVFKRTLGNTAKPFVVVLDFLRLRESTKNHEVMKMVLIGLVISCPLLTVILSLLTSADRVFKDYVEKIFATLASIRLTALPLQGILVVIVSVLVFSYTWSFLKPKSEHKEAAEPSLDLNSTSRGWDPIISITILSVINIVYIAFTFFQFAYMFGSLNHVLPSDFTYAEYARRGFFELLIVTLLNFSLLMSSISFTRKGKDSLAKALRILHSLLVLCTMVILVSAYLRMSLYEDAYGYTYLRVLTHSFMMYLFAVFLIAFYKLWNERISLLKLYIVITMAAYVILNFSNIDVMIAKKNIERYTATGKIDTHYLKNLSYDSIPVVVNLLKDDNVPADFKEYLSTKQAELSKKQAWQSFNFSKYRAKQALSAYHS